MESVETMIIWVIVGLLVLLLLVFLVALAMRKDKRLPPTDYYTFFIMGIIWLGAGIPLMISANSPALFIMGLVFMGVGLAHKDEWKKNREANKWENLNKDQRRMKQILLWTMLGILLAGVLTFVVIYLVAL